MKKKLNYLILLFLGMVFTSNYSYAQITTMDSLQNVINSVNKNCPNPCLLDSNKVNALNAISIEYIKKGDYEKGKEIAYQAIDLSKQIGFKKGVGEALNSIGTTYYYQGGLDEALEYYLKSLEIREENGDKKGTASSYNNISLIHKNQGRYEQALEYLLKSIKIKESINDKDGMAASYNNISIIYKKQGLLEQAIEYTMKSLKLNEETDNQKGLASSYNNIGLIFHEQNDIEQALEYLIKCLQLYEKINDQKNISKTLNNIGLIHIDKKQYELAMEFYKKGLKIEEKAGNIRDAASFYTNIANCYMRFFTNYATINFENPEYKSLSKSNLLDSAKFYHGKAYDIHNSIGDRISLIYNITGFGSIFFQQKEPLKALNKFYEALAISEELNSKIELKNSYGHIVDALKELGRYKEALEFFEKHKALSDTLVNTETQKSINRHEARYEYDKKQLADSLRHNEQARINENLHQEEIKKKEVLIYSGAVGFIFMLVLALVLFKSFRAKQKSNFLITNQKEEIELRHREITDSINYAKRIQEALLKETDHVSENLPSHFILYKPKDIISGDFYWSLEQHGCVYIAVADCTGHGVPGAMMSMLGIAFLNEITNGEKFLTPSEILEKLREKIIKELNQTGQEGENKDGMDISMACLNLSTKQLNWAGANNPIWIISSESEEGQDQKEINSNSASPVSNLILKEIKPNKQPIGYHPNQTPFINNVLQLKKDSIFYLITDGYHDQFGGAKGKKFKPAQLKELILNIHSKPMEEQKQILNSKFHQWKGELEQVDDVCIIGMKV
ncbi:MAG: tetratricopeptide repeat protein [Bacteroidota bacterium]|nr:tetratricopeptide repeat protein [Bacteroidota bacterium]